MIDRMITSTTGRKIVGILMAFAVATPTMAAVDSCRNTQIISYSPDSNSRVEQIETVEFTVTEDTQISSLEVTINNEELPVQYSQNDDGTYDAKALVPEYMEGSLYVDMGAGSQEAGSCNDVLSTSFVTGPFDEYNQYGVPTSQNYSYTAPQTVASTPTESTDTVARATSQEEDTATQDTQMVDTDREETIATNVSEEDTATATDEEATSTEKELASADTDDTQAASIWGSMAGLLGLGEQASCTTLGASWAWYVWLGIIWVWLVGLWMLVNYTVEPALGTNRYGRRLAWTMGLGTLAALAFWFLANPCFTHIWAAVVFIILGVVLYWLYSEEGDTHTTIVTHR